MIVANFMTVKPEMATARTYEDFSKFLGKNETRLGILSRMPEFEKMTASYLTEGIGNIYGKPQGDKYSPIENMAFTWEVLQQNIKYIPMVEPCVKDAGQDGMEFRIVFPEKYYGVDDTFIFETSKQMCIVITEPNRVADGYWEYGVKLMSGSLDAKLSDMANYAGSKTRWIGNVKQEYHSNGCVKFHSNVEKMRGYINEIRVDIDASARYEVFEQSFIKLAKGSEANGWEEKIFAWPEKKKVLLENFMAARNQSLLWQHTTMDVDGKATITDAEGRPIIAGDGIIPQIQRYASKFNYTTLDTKLFNRMLITLSKKCNSATGNNFVFVVNSKLYYDMQEALATYLDTKMTDGAYLWNKEGKKIKVGATYGTYEFAGNTLAINVDNALDLEYPDKGFGLLLDLTGEKYGNRPAIEMFTVKGHQFMENHYTGVGIQSGAVASPTAGVKYIMSGYCGVAVYSPSRSVLLYEN